MRSAIFDFRLAILIALAPAALTLFACRGPSRSQMSARAADEWLRNYSLDKGGEVSVFNQTGAIDLEGVEGTTVEIRAERVARATTEKTAAQLLPRISITEDILPNRVSVRTAGIEGILVGVSFDVTYHVKVPPWAILRAQTSSGDTTARGISGRVVASTTNGSITGRTLGGGVETRAVNGDTTVDFTSLGGDPVALRGTNGSVTVALPSSANANLQASAVNGTISFTRLMFEPTDDPEPERGRARRVRGRLNAGGTSLELQTVNGDIAISARESQGHQDQPRP